MYEDIGTSRGTDYFRIADIESIHTYEGTKTIQTLIVGRDITGVGAFA